MLSNFKYRKLVYRDEVSKIKTNVPNNIQNPMLKMLFFIAFAFALIFILPPVLGATTKNVLILNSYHKGDQRLL